MNFTDYVELNASLPKPFAFCLSSRGFYSEVNNLLNAILFGIIKKRRLIVDESLFANGSLRWSSLYQADLSLLYCDSISEVENAWIVKDFWSPGFGAIASKVKQWHQMRRLFSLRSQGFYPSVYVAKRMLASFLCKPQSLPEEPSLSGENYAAIHIRRGDKTEGFKSHGHLIVEGEAIPVESYLRILRKTGYQGKNIFVLTDDYRVVDEIYSILPGFNIVTNCCKSDHGYRQASFDEMSSGAKFDAAKRLLAEVDIACKSQVFIGCYRSNVSRYIALAHQNPDNCYSADSISKWHPL